MAEPSPDDLAAARSDLDKLVRRLRRFGPRAWATGDNAGRVRALAEALAVIGAEGHQLPEVPDRALADVVAVVGHDALEVHDATAAVHALLKDALDRTR